MQLNPAEISDLIKAKIENLSANAEVPVVAARSPGHRASVISSGLELAILHSLRGERGERFFALFLGESQDCLLLLMKLFPHCCELLLLFNETLFCHWLLLSRRSPAGLRSVRTQLVA